VAAGDALKFFKCGRKAGKFGGRLLHEVEKEEGKLSIVGGALKLRLKEMEKDAMRAKEGIGKHGLSVNTSSRGKPSRSAARRDVEDQFPVVQTGRDPGHHTVVLPEPITPDIVRRWNDLFK
jgi:hypothetical protein